MLKIPQYVIIIKSINETRTNNEILKPFSQLSGEIKIIKTKAELIAKGISALKKAEKEIDITDDRDLILYGSPFLDKEDFDKDLNEIQYLNPKLKLNLGVDALNNRLKVAGDSYVNNIIATKNSTFEKEVKGSNVNMKATLYGVAAKHRINILTPDGEWIDSEYHSDGTDDEAVEDLLKTLDKYQNDNYIFCQEYIEKLEEVRTYI